MNSYSQQKAMSRRFICSQGIMSFRSSPSVIITNDCTEKKYRDLLSMPLYKREEIYQFARSYTDRMLITEDDGKTWIISPSVFPASSLCAVFCFDIEPRRFLRLVKNCKCEQMFECSQYADFKNARMSTRLLSQAEDISRFCTEIRQCFYGMERIKRAKTPEAQRKTLLEQCHRLSMLTGCPIDVDISPGDYASTDLSILTAFLFTMLISARRNAQDRMVRLSFSSRAGSALVKISFTCDAPICISREMLEWEGIAADRCMEFYSVADDRAITVEFHAHRYELSAILGIKQEDIPFLREDT